MKIQIDPAAPQRNIAAMTTAMTGREYEVLAILNENFETLSPEKQERVMIMFCAAQGYKPYKINNPDRGGNRPTSNYRRKAKPS